MTKLVPLIGAKQFSELMRQKPLAHWGTCVIHAQWINTEQNTPLTPQAVELGQIVPKKAYPLAVDRNRVRRLLRAHSLAVAKDWMHANGQTGLIRILFRIKAIDKKARLQGIAQQANPHTQAFSLAIQTMVKKSLQGALLNAATVSNTSPTAIQTKQAITIANQTA